MYTGEVGLDDEEDEVVSEVTEGPDVGVLVRLYSVQTKYVISLFLWQSTLCIYLYIMCTFLDNFGLVYSK